MPLIALFLLLALTLPAAAQPQPQPEAPPPPDLPAADEMPPPDELEPEVVIREEEERVIEEYRVNGQLYMVKITPSRGRPYYLLDTDGDGRLDTRRHNLDSPRVNVWRIFEW